MRGFSTKIHTSYKILDTKESIFPFLLHPLSSREPPASQLSCTNFGNQHPPNFGECPFPLRKRSSQYERITLKYLSVRKVNLSISFPVKLHFPCIFSSKIYVLLDFWSPKHYLALVILKYYGPGLSCLNLLK